MLQKNELYLSFLRWQWKDLFICTGPRATGQLTIECPVCVCIHVLISHSQVASGGRPLLSLVTQEPKYSHNNVYWATRDWVNEMGDQCISRRLHTVRRMNRNVNMRNQRDVRQMKRRNAGHSDVRCELWFDLIFLSMLNAFPHTLGKHSKEEEEEERATNSSTGTASGLVVGLGSSKCVKSTN